MRTVLTWSVIAVLAGSAAVVWIGRQHANARLRATVELRRRQLHAALVSRREEPTTAHPATPPPVFVDRRQTDAILVRKRTELAELRQCWQQLQPFVPTESPADPGRFPVGLRVPASAWTNAGNATPAAAFETALWSAAGGDVDRLAKLLVFPDEQARTAAQALYDALAAADRERYQSPERLIAALTIPRVPTAAVEVKEWGDVEGHSVTLLIAKLAGVDGTERSVMIPFEAQPGGWKLLVTRDTVARFAAQLHPIR